MAAKKKKKGKQAPFSTSPPQDSAPVPIPQEGSRPTHGIVRLDLDPIINNIYLKTNKELIQNIIDRRNGNNLISVVLRDRVLLLPNIIHPFFEVLKLVGRSDHLDLFLSTTGGATEVPWRIVSLIREFYRTYTAIIPFIAVSAGTHIALGANSLVMSEISTLGPVDPTTQHPLLPRDKDGKPIPVSVEDLKNCIRFISQQLKDQNGNEKYSPSDMTNIVGKLFEHIEPLAIGAVERSYALSRLITRRVLETHLDPNKDKEKIDRIVNRIGGEYFSHSFPITVRDMEQDLQLKVERPNSELFESIWTLYEYYRGAFSQESNITLTLEPPGGAQAQRRNLIFVIRMMGYIDSISERRILIQLNEVKKDPSSDKVIEENRLTRWIKPKEEGLPLSSGAFFEARSSSPPRN